MKQSLLLPVRERFADWPLALKTIFGFWLVYAATVLARSVLYEDTLTLLQNKAVTIAAGVILTLLIYAAIQVYGERRGVRGKAIIAGVGSLVAAFGLSGTLMVANAYMREPNIETRYQAREGFVVIQRGLQLTIERRAEDPLVITMPKIAGLERSEKLRIILDSSVVWLFFFAGWSAFYLATLAQHEALSAKRRAAEAETQAHAAQVRALRYQVNPHFLFNTLNSLSSLVMSGRADQAEKMLLALSTFFRTSLSLDPGADVSLAEEIELQRRYLEIEEVRFPNRLRVDIDVPRVLADARVPALILQPIVENAIKYGVAATREKMVLAIHASRLGDGRMQLDVINHVADGAGKDVPMPQHQGTGLGLTNVCQRLEAHFNGRADCRFGPLSRGGFKVSLAIPLDDDD